MEKLIELIFGMPGKIEDKKEYHRAIFKILSTLSHREAVVLFLRLPAGMSVRQVAKNLGVTPERIWQVQLKAFMKLINPSRSRQLKKYLAR